MKTIALISGPALGHVGRLYATALAIQERQEVDIRFIYPSVSGYAQRLVQGSVDSVPIAVDRSTYLEGALTFAAGVERLFLETDFSLVVQDAEPLSWTSLLRFPSAPRVNVTNAFLTRLRPAPTFQEQVFSQISSRLNEMRREKGMPALESVYDLYEADLVLLADPRAVVDGLGPAPANYVQCGPCFWEFEGPLPDALARLDDILLFTMGSTGRTRFDEQTLTVVRELVGRHTSVYAGSRSEEIRGRHGIRWAFDQVPLAPVLARAKAAISSGGAGSTYQALLHGCPTFVYPGHQNQRILGDLLETLGLGFCLADDASRERLLQVDFVELRETVVRFAEVEAKVDGAREIARQISALI